MEPPVVVEKLCTDAVASAQGESGGSMTWRLHGTDGHSSPQNAVASGSMLSRSTKPGKARVNPG